MENDRFASSAELVLNFLPATFSAAEIAGFRLDYEDKEQLRDLQNRFRGTLFLRRFGKTIQIVQLSSTAEVLDAEPCVFSAREDWGLFDRLLEEGIRRFLRTTYHPRMRVPEFGPIRFSVAGEQYDLVQVALAQQRNALAKLSFLHVYRKYHLQGSHLRRDQRDDPLFGVLVQISTNWQFSASIADLVARGVDVTGCYAVPLNVAWTEHSIGHKIAGCISRVNDTVVDLVDFRDHEVIDAREYTIEARPENVARCVNAVLGAQGSAAMQHIYAEVGRLTSAEGQLQRIKGIATELSKAPISCAVDLDATVGQDALTVDPQSLCTALRLESPRYMLKYGRNPVAGPIATALSAQGPFDQDSFRKTTPHVLVVTPKQWLGRVEQFLRTWRDGGIRAPYQRGFTQQYRLRGCDFHFVEFQETPQGPAADYQQACLRALQESRELVRRYDVAFVVIQEQHRLLGGDDPYLVTKAALMNDGVPVQEIEIETIDLPTEGQPFVLNNLALAVYAKMGGTPWLLASSKGQGITHEVIIGLGSAAVQESRIRERERFVGITTLFNYDGVYLVSNVSRESAYDEYSAALQSVLLASLEYVSIQKGWQPGDRVRLIFHTFKPLRDLEIRAVKSLVEEGLSHYAVDFAFLEIGHDHGWSVYDRKSPGYTSRKGLVRGKQAPARGTLVILDERRALLSVTGPMELKRPDQGCPTPLQIKLNGASTFSDLEYLARQVFEFSYMSWKTFNLLPMPITIAYSEVIAGLLGRLRRVRNWNANALQTTQLKASLWFL